MDEKMAANIIKSAALFLSKIKETYEDRKIKYREDYEVGIMNDKNPFNTTLQVAQLMVLLDIKEKLDILVRVQ